MNAAIGIPGYARPDCLEQTIKAIKVWQGDLPLYVNIDPGGADPDQLKQIVGAADCEVNRERLTVRWNVRRLLDRIFEKHEMAIILEDDVVTAPDIQELCRWFWGFEDRNDYLALCLFNHSRGQEPPQIIAESKHFSPTGWVVTRHRYLDFISNWSIDLRGWDFAMNKAMKQHGWKTLCPLLSRTTHIGRVGTFQRPEHWDRVYSQHKMNRLTGTGYQFLPIPEGHLRVT